MGRRLKNSENYAMMSWCDNGDDNDDGDDGDNADDKQGWADVSRGRSSVVAAAAS